MDQKERNGLQEIIDNALAEMADEVGEDFDPSRANLAVFCSKTGLTRSRARTLKKKGFKVTPHGRCGMKAEVTVLTGHTDTLDGLLRDGVTNSSVCLDRIRARGYRGGLTTVKDYIAAHRHLVPAKRKTAVVQQGNRGRRYKTEPGECYQMDWGFVTVEDWLGNAYRVACFAMVCHHCGTSYVEFFPDARQENLFIGMIHAFMLMGVPEWVLTDNMKCAAAHFMFNGGSRVMRSPGAKRLVRSQRTPHYILVSVVSPKSEEECHDRRKKGLPQSQVQHRGVQQQQVQGLRPSHGRRA